MKIHPRSCILFNKVPERSFFFVVCNSKYFTLIYYSKTKDVENVLSIFCVSHGYQVVSVKYGNLLTLYLIALFVVENYFLFLSNLKNSITVLGGAVWGAESYLIFTNLFIQADI